MITFNPRVPPVGDPNFSLQLTNVLRDLGTRLDLLSQGHLSGARGQGTAAPTTGTWAKGDIIRNSDPVSGSLVWGWICTTAGTPGTWDDLSVGGGAGASLTEVEIDFGTKPVYDASFTITDAAITSSAKKVLVSPSGKAATGRTADDWQFDGASIAANPGSGSATVYVTFHPGPVVGPRKFQYMVA